MSALNQFVKTSVEEDIPCYLLQKLEAPKLGKQLSWQQVVDTNLYDFPESELEIEEFVYEKAIVKGLPRYRLITPRIVSLYSLIANLHPGLSSELKCCTDFARHPVATEAPRQPLDEIDKIRTYEETFGY